MLRACLAGLIAAATIAATRSVLPPSQPRPDAARPAAGLDSIGSPAGPGSAEPSLAVAPDGRVFMTWLEPLESGHALRFAALDGTRWSAARTIRTGRDFFVNWADFPSIEVLDGSRLAAHWLQRGNGGTYNYGVRIALSSDGGATWSAPIQPHRDSSRTEHGFVALWREPTPAGALGAVWLDGRKVKPGRDPGNEMMLMGTTLDARGRLGPEARLDERTCDCCQTAAAMTAAGPIVAYRDRSPDEIRDIHVTRRVGGTWTAGAPVHRDGWKVDYCPVNGPAVSAAGRRGALAWFTGAQERPRVQLAFSDDAGATFGGPVRIDGGSPAGRVDVALLPDGGALVTWIERTGGDTAAVRARRVTRDGKAGPALTVAASSAQRASGFPRMAVTGGDVVFAWTAPGRPSRVRVARTPLASLR